MTAKSLSTSTPTWPAKRCAEFASRLGFVKIEAEALEWLVVNHMAIHTIKAWGEKKRLEIYRHPFFKVLVALQEADARASWRNADGSEYAEVLREFLESDSKELLAKSARDDEVSNLCKKVTEMLKARGFQPGSLFGEVNKAVVAWLGDRKVADVEREALGFALGWATCATRVK